MRRKYCTNDMRFLCWFPRYNGRDSCEDGRCFGCLKTVYITDCPEGCQCRNETMLYRCNGSALPLIPPDAGGLDFSNSVLRIEELKDEWYFLTYLNMSNCSISSTAIFERANNFKILRVLDLRFNEIQQISKPILPALEELYLDENPLHSIDIEVKLRTLSLSGTRLQSMIFRNETFMRCATTLDVSRSRITAVTPPYTVQRKDTSDFNLESKLIILNLSYNAIQDLTAFCFWCSNLIRLDLSYNQIENISMTSFSGLRYLKYLSLRGNRIITKITKVLLVNVCWLEELDLGQNRISVIDNNAFDRLVHLMILHLDHNRLLHIPARLFRQIKYMYLLNVAHNQISTMTAKLMLQIKELRHLNVSNNRLNHLAGSIFQHNFGIKTLDIRNNNLDAASEIFLGLWGLEKLYVNTFSLCCARPVHMLNQDCIWEQRIISSCAELIDIGVLKVFIWYGSFLCFVGNGMALWHRFRSKALVSNSHNILVTQLCAADILVGIYLFIIGTVDKYTELQFAYMHTGWRQSAVCSLSGALITTANQASALFVLMITFDKLLVLTFKSFAEIRHQTTVNCSVCIWFLSFTLAVIQRVPGIYFPTDIYSMNAFCLPFPLTSYMISDRNWIFALGMHCVFRMGLYLLICIGQVMIVRAVRFINKKKKTTKQKRKATAMATAVIVTCGVSWITTTALGKQIFNSLGCIVIR